MLFLGCAPHLVVVGLLLASGGVQASETVTVFAAASTTDVLTTIATQYTTATGVRIVCSFGGSSTLARQIEAGAPADVFLSADEAWMDHVQQAGAIQAQTRRDLLGNRLVLVGPVAQPLVIPIEPTFAFAAAFSGRLAVADPTHVPAGRYAQQALQGLGWWEGVRDRLAPTADVRAALRLVERNEVALGIVYATDAACSQGVTVVATFPETLHTPIRYPVAVTSTGGPAALAFVDYLSSPVAQASWEQAGFINMPRVQAPAGTP